MKSGENVKVYQFPKTTRRKIVCQYMTDTITEPLPCHKENDRLYWPTILGIGVGLIYISILFLF